VVEVAEQGTIGALMLNFTAIPDFTAIPAGYRQTAVDLFHAMLA
jgi:hypothetical protein